MEHMRDVLGNNEVRGPRNITSSNVDRIFDDAGKRFLIIEEKNPGEQIKEGQRRLLANLAKLPRVDVWGVRGTPDALTVNALTPTGFERTAEGDFDTYQRCVHAWFAAEHDDLTHALDVLGPLPYTAPNWCPPEVWARFDMALSEVMAVAANRPKARNA